MRKTSLATAISILATAFFFGFTPIGVIAGTTADTSQQFSVGNLPQEIAINLHTIEKDSADTQPRLKYLKFTDLKIAEDGKTVQFNIENSFDLPDAKPILLGGLMLSSMVHYDYDGGAQLHTVVLLKDKRVILKRGVNSFKTDPGLYPNVTDIAKLQFFIMPPRTDFIRQKVSVSSDVPDTSQSFPTSNLPDRIIIDRGSVAQNASQRDPRLEYIEISGLKAGADGKTIEFSVDNTFRRQKMVPIHVGAFMVSGMARYNYDNGAELHSTVILSKMQVTFKKGSTHFKTDPSLYPNVTKLESVRFYFAPVSQMRRRSSSEEDIVGSVK